jgi:hypothetical protein
VPKLGINMPNMGTSPNFQKAYPYRYEWQGFPAVILHVSDERLVKHHPAYTAAKAGDSDAAFELVKQTINENAILAINNLAKGKIPLLVSAHAFEQSGVNAIPEALADELSTRTGFPVESSIVQSNVVGHTGANGFTRLARQALFKGDVQSGADYILVDDFVGQGGTLANLRGYIEQQGGIVIGATALTGRPYSAKLSITDQQLAELRSKHGTALENWWKERFGHSFDCLTQSEARYLTKTPDADRIRDSIVAAE